MPPPSIARNFFEGIVNASDPVAAIRGLINSSPPTVERDWLEFKGQHRDPKQRDKKFGEQWSEALGGFANNQGGVLVWGADARQKPVKGGAIDGVWEEQPVDYPVALASRLTELQRQATDPPLANVEVKPCPLPTKPDQGFVVCFIPEGPDKPYRSEQAAKQWFLRAGDSFVVMSRSMLASMFYPRTHPAFRTKAKLSWEVVIDPQTALRRTVRMTCEMDLVNEGTGTAKDVTVVVMPNVEGNLGPIEFGGSSAFSFHDWSRDKEFHAIRPLHRDRLTPLCSARWDVEAICRGLVDVPRCFSPSFELSIFCENQGQKVIRIEFDEEEIIENKKGCICEVRPVE
jgi:hypothetical protein